MNSTVEGKKKKEKKKEKQGISKVQGLEDDKGQIPSTSYNHLPA